MPPERAAPALLSQSRRGTNSLVVLKRSGEQQARFQQIGGRVVHVVEYRHFHHFPAQLGIDFAALGGVDHRHEISMAALQVVEEFVHVENAVVLVEVGDVLDALNRLARVRAAVRLRELEDSVALVVLDIDFDELALAAEIERLENRVVVVAVGLIVAVAFAVTVVAVVLVVAVAFITGIAAFAGGIGERVGVLLADLDREVGVGEVLVAAAEIASNLTVFSNRSRIGATTVRFTVAPSGNIIVSFGA